MFRSIVKNSTRLAANTVSRRLNHQDASMFARFRSNIPTYGAIVGTCALIFQITVLFPWHIELSNEFIKVEKEVEATTKIAHDQETKMSKLIEIEEQIKDKEKKILEREEEILSIENKVLSKLDQLIQEQRQHNLNQMVRASVQSAIHNKHEE